MLAPATLVGNTVAMEMKRAGDHEIDFHPGLGCPQLTNPDIGLGFHRTQRYSLAWSSVLSGRPQNSRWTPAPCV